ncbi:MAG: hypothetical protein A3D35_02380 [Candidatus Staskawiczbacteria bacterium RIFCSPHIGHO2_02_FULL_34_9]|uniref:Uncharacterized protein n=1 Tax=Candidatus Staskawiczbacteria bacterium RIFCSPHIGHO2_02_FULL_34_9 TaxID=1802206 RepID=A0A1G2HYH0_9BACT|nr:MAG: hypothetical protein A3D35_02380 [Candidatus Staskawiczbacteria bacterium RIFCSPHIGHO2_02_FULL_34_9]
MKKKNVTIDDLAIMVQKGFDGVDISFDRIEGKLDKAEGRLIKIEIRMDNVESEIEEIRKHQIVHTIYRDEFEKLQNRVKALEKLLIKG